MGRVAVDGFKAFVVQRMAACGHDRRFLSRQTKARVERGPADGTFRLVVRVEVVRGGDDVEGHPGQQMDVIKIGLSNCAGQSSRKKERAEVELNGKNYRACRRNGSEGRGGTNPARGQDTTESVCQGNQETQVRKGARECVWMASARREVRKRLNGPKARLVGKGRKRGRGGPEKAIRGFDPFLARTRSIWARLRSVLFIFSGPLAGCASHVEGGARRWRVAGSNRTCVADAGSGYWPPALPRTRGGV